MLAYYIKVLQGYTKELSIDEAVEKVIERKVRLNKVFGYRFTMSWCYKLLKKCRTLVLVKEAFMKEKS